MSPLTVALCYGSAIVVSLLLLWRFGTFTPLFHFGVIVLAFLLGFVQLPEFWTTPVGTLIVGWTFLVLLTWGMGGIALRLVHFDRLHHGHGR